MNDDTIMFADTLNDSDVRLVFREIIRKLAHLREPVQTMRCDTSILFILKACLSLQKYTLSYQTAVRSL